MRRILQFIVTCGVFSLVSAQAKDEGVKPSYRAVSCDVESNAIASPSGEYRLVYRQLSAGQDTPVGRARVEVHHRDGRMTDQASIRGGKRRPICETCDGDSVTLGWSPDGVFFYVEKGVKERRSVSIYYLEKADNDIGFEVCSVYTTPMYTGDAPIRPAEDRVSAIAELRWKVGQWNMRRLSVELLCEVRKTGEHKTRTYQYVIPLGLPIGRFFPDKDFDRSVEFECNMEEAGAPTVHEDELHFNKHLESVYMKNGDKAPSPVGKYSWQMCRNVQPESAQSAWAPPALLLFDGQKLSLVQTCNPSGMDTMMGCIWSPDGAYYAILMRHATMQYTVGIYFIQEPKGNDDEVTVHRIYKSPAYTGDSTEIEKWTMQFARLYWHIKDWNMDEMAVMLECELMDDEIEQSYRRYEYKVPIGVPVN